MAGEIIDQFTEHEALSKSRFLDQFKNSVDLKALAASYAEQIQDLEDAFFEIILERSLPDAVGAQLTILGKIVGQPRTSSDDTEFKIAIDAKIAINLSQSTPNELIRILVSMFLLAAQETFVIKEEPPAQLRVTIIDILTIDPILVQQLLDSADPAGNRLLLSYSPAATSTRLRFTDDSAGTPTGLRGTGSAAGFGDSIGGHTGGSTVSVVGG